MDLTKALKTMDLEELRRLREDVNAAIRAIESESESEWQFVLCVDFDGVIHSYKSGWQGDATTISDPPTPGAFDWLRRVVDHEKNGRRYFRVCIYSSRSKEPGGIEAIQKWMLEHGFDELTLGLIEFPVQKPAASLMIDDRAWLFEGEFPSISQMLNFKPWTKR